MPAYVIVDVHIHDESAYASYKMLTPEVISAFDGKSVVRGGAVATLEGDWQAGLGAVLEFPSVKRAEEWRNAPQYTEAKRIRQSAAAIRIIVVEGVERTNHEQRV